MLLSRAFKEGLIVSIVGVSVVGILSGTTNEMAPRWDMAYYRDMAANGLLHNDHLVAPHAFRPAASLVVGAISRCTGLSIADTFHDSVRLMSFVLIVLSFLLARRFGADAKNALWIAVVLLLNAIYIKFPLFWVSMVDIYAYSIFLLAFYMLWEERSWITLLIAAPGLLVKEFLLVPLMTVAGLWTFTYWRQWRRLLVLLAAIGVILITFFILPRVFIHVVASYQDIDPAYPRSLVRLIKYPLDPRRWFNICFGYIAIWLPIFMLLNGPRLVALWKRLEPRAPLLVIFLAMHFLLVMYGGTNVLVYVSYTLPFAILVMSYLVEDGKPHFAELVLITIAVILFNRAFSPIPVPESGLGAAVPPTSSDFRYLNYYGGYFNMVTLRSFLRLGEAVTYIAAAQLLRRLISTFNRSRPNSYTQTPPAAL